jgi:ketopantoate reductase
LFDYISAFVYNARMKTLIYGGGSVGLGLASCLLKSNNEVDILARENTVQELIKAGLHRTGIFGEFLADSSQFGGYSSLGQIEEKVYNYFFVHIIKFIELRYS